MSRLLQRGKKTQFADYKIHHHHHLLPWNRYFFFFFFKKVSLLMLALYITDGAVYNVAA
jgi:hypothetical protein